MNHTQIFLWCVALILLELNHLKWIVWTQWACGKCSRTHEHCSCSSSKWFMYL